MTFCLKRVYEFWALLPWHQLLSNPWSCPESVPDILSEKQRSFDPWMRHFKIHTLTEHTNAMLNLVGEPIVFNLSPVIPVGSHGDGMLMIYHVNSCALEDVSSRIYRNTGNKSVHILYLKFLKFTFSFCCILFLVRNVIPPPHSLLTSFCLSF